jgi:hypothetical protein
MKFRSEISNTVGLITVSILKYISVNLLGYYSFLIVNMIKKLMSFIFTIHKKCCFFIIVLFTSSNNSYYYSVKFLTKNNKKK